MRGDAAGAASWFPPPAEHLLLACRPTGAVPALRGARKGDTFLSLGHGVARRFWTAKARRSRSLSRSARRCSRRARSRTSLRDYPCWRSLPAVRTQENKGATRSEQSRLKPAGRRRRSERSLVLALQERGTTGVVAEERAKIKGVGWYKKTPSLERILALSEATPCPNFIKSNGVGIGS